MTDTKANKILVVDDDESTVTILRRLLKKSGFTDIVSAHDARQALNIVEKAREPFSLVISDYFMPEMKGSELLKKISELSPDTRRIIITGHQNFAEAVEAINKGAVHQYIGKPWDNEDLLSKISSELDFLQQTRARAHYYTILKRQNARLYKAARDLKEKEKQFKNQLAQKKKKKARLAQKLEELEQKQDFQNKVFEAYPLISWNVVIDRESLVKTFALIKKEADSILEAICRKHDIPFPGDGDPFTLPLTDKTGQGPTEALYHLVDTLLQYAGRLAEPALFNLGKERLENREMGDEAPDIGELALKEGYISKPDFDRASMALAERRVEEPGISMERILKEKDLLSRMDLSRLYVKRTLANTRSADAPAAEELKARGVPEETITRAFIKQMNLFLEKGTAVSTGKLLAAAGVIDEKTRQALFRDGEEPEGPGKPALSGEAAAGREQKEVSTDLVNIEISDDRTKAYLHIGLDARESFSASDIFEILEAQGIRYGFLDETLIEGYLKHSKKADKRLVVAAGKKPVPGKNAQITYHFNTDYQRPGVIESDGSIDFRERGEIPFVRENTLLAEKTPMAKGESGIDIYGEVIPTEEVYDQVLYGGAGTSFSENGLKLFATIEGQPDLDAKGVVSVHKELSIKGDVSYKTGHINYEGNVVVTGTIREGFHVKCVDLTVNAANGAVIETSGNLNVSQGIVNSRVNVQGSLMAMYIQSSVIDVFGDITVTREIMESDIACGSEIFNERGKVIDATVAARKGMALYQVGTEKSGRSTLKTGVEDHINRLTQRFDKHIAEKEEEIRKLEEEKQTIESKIFRLHKQAADLSFAQESKTGEIEALKQQFAGLKGRKNEMIALKTDIKEKEKLTARYDTEIKAIFQSQDMLMKNVEEKEKGIERVSLKITDIRTEKEALAEVAALDQPNPFIKIIHRATSGTRIYGPHTSMVVKHDLRPCKVMEIESSDPNDPEQKKLVIQNL